MKEGVMNGANKEDMVIRLIESIRGTAISTGNCICGAEIEYEVIDEEKNVYRVSFNHADDCFIRLAGQANAEIFISITSPQDEEEVGDDVGT
jgi:hypothetical protein